MNIRDMTIERIVVNQLRSHQVDMFVKGYIGDVNFKETSARVRSEEDALITLSKMLSNPDLMAHIQEILELELSNDI